MTKIMRVEPGFIDQPLQHWPRNYLLPSVGLAVTVVYNTQVAVGPLVANLRWVLLVALAAIGGLTVWQLGGGTPMRSPLILLALFSLTTFAFASYSLIPLFSLYKAISFALAFFGLVVGLGLRYRHSPEIWLGVLAGFNLVVVGVTLVTLLLPAAHSFDSGQLQGPFSNPNSLGSSLALTLPALLWLRDRRPRRAGRSVKRHLLSVPVGLNLFFVWASGSRASLVVLILTFVLYLALRSYRVLVWLTLSLLVLVLAAPQTLDFVARQAIYKGQNPSSAFTDRIVQFQTTRRAAASRPVSGYGFGVSADDTRWDGAFSAVSVGREKANSYLGLIEEVGLFGAVLLFLALLGALAICYRTAWKQRGSSDWTATPLFMVVAGGILHCNFEAWLTAVGSFEAFIFWSTFGVMLLSQPTFETTKVAHP